VVLAGGAAYVGAVYALVVLGGGALLHTPPPNVALAVLATAVVAVTLEPVRHRLRRRLGLSPYERLAAFGAEAAGAVATDQVAGRMARLLAEATGARCVEVRLVDDGREVPAATWPPGVVPADPGAPGVRVHDVVDAGELLARIVRYPGAGGAPGVVELSPVEQGLVDDLVGEAGLAVRSVALAARLRRRIAESTQQAAQLRASRQRVVTAADAARDPAGARRP
jgi:hypothetical protein